MKKTEANLMVGIAARNEEKTIYKTLNSLIAETVFFPRSIIIRVIIVLNGCTDNTLREIRRFKTDMRPQKNREIIIEKAKEGLVVAQQKIWRQRKRNDLVIFIDADIILKPRSLYILYRHISNLNTKAVWASFEPIYKPNTKSLSLTRVLNFRDYHSSVFEVRKYLCGRVFSVREYDLNIKGVKTTTNMDPRLSKLLSLDEGPVVDDIYLTRYFRLKYGVESIENNVNAVAYYNPITNIVDFYLNQRRTVIEMYRLELLYPEEAITAKSTLYLKKRINQTNFHELSLVGKMECFFYILLYAFCRKISKIELQIKMALVLSGIPLRSINIWPSIKSSKVEFRNLNTAKSFN